MTPLPKRRISSRRQGRRRADHQASFLKLSKCPNCGKPTPSHTACKHCGFYKGRQVKKIRSAKSAQNQLKSS